MLKNVLKYKKLYWQLYYIVIKYKFYLTYIKLYCIILVRKEGVRVDKNVSLASIKKNIENHLGEKVTLKANGGRKKVLVNDGIIESTYPSIFVIRLENDTQRTVTYSYSDVLTNTVQLVFPNWFLDFEKIRGLFFWSKIIL